MRLFYAFSPIIILVAVAGCAPATAPGDAKSGKSSDVIEADPFESVPVSGPMTTNVSNRTCDEEKSLKLFSGKTDVQQIKKIWNECQELYACSESAKKFFDETERASISVRVGATQIQSILQQSGSDTVLGAYVSGKGRIYLDSSINDIATACEILLHEFVHRVASSADKNEVVKDEYVAYWQQFAFKQDLALLDGALGQHYRRKELNAVTGELLLEVIAKKYNQKADPSILTLRPKLPLETKIRR